MKNINVLFVSIAFPPKSDSEGLQVAKYLKYLAADENLTIDVVTSTDKTLFMTIDETLRSYTMDCRQIIKLSFFENKYVNYVLRKINPYILNYPDSKYLFVKQWKKAVLKLKNKPDIIYSRSFPLSSTLMAYKLQKELHVPWILHLSDPWTISPIHKLGSAQSWNEKMEQKCFKSATKISFTSQQTIDLYVEKYPEYKSKMMLFPNVFDLEDKREKIYEFKDKIKVVYTGGFVEDRSPKYLFKAILELHKKNPDIVNEFEFIFAGALDRKNRALFQQDIPSVKHVGLLSYSEAISLQEQADILLIVDTPFNNASDAMFLPSKILDYMLMKRRILALTNKHSVTWNLVNHTLGNCYTYDDTENIIKFLTKTRNAHKNRDKEFFVTNNIDMNYSAQENSKKLAEVIRKVFYEK